MSNELKILITAGLNGIASQREIQKQLDIISNNLQINLGVNSNNLKEAQGQIQQLQKTVNNITDKSSKVELFPSNTKDNITSQVAGYKNLQDRVNEIKNSAKDLSNVSMQSGKDINNIHKATISYTDQMGRSVSETYKLIQKNQENISGKDGELTPYKINSEWIKDSHTINDNIAKRNKLIEDEVKQRQKLADQIGQGRESSNAKRIQEENNLIKNQATAINKTLEDRKKLESDYDQWWQKSLKERDIKQEQVSQRQIQTRKKQEQEYDNFWQKSLKERSITEERQVDQMAQKRASANRKSLDERLELERRQAQAINNSIDDQYKKNQAQKKETIELQKQLDLEQRKMRIRASEMVRQYPSIDKGRINSILAESNAMSTQGQTLQSVQGRYKELNMQMKEVEAQTKRVTANTNTLSGAFQNAMVFLPSSVVTY